VKVYFFNVLHYIRLELQGCQTSDEISRFVMIIRGFIHNSIDFKQLWGFSAEFFNWHPCVQFICNFSVRTVHVLPLLARGNSKVISRIGHYTLQTDSLNVRQTAAIRKSEFGRIFAIYPRTYCLLL